MDEKQILTCDRCNAALEEAEAQFVYLGNKNTAQSAPAVPNVDWSICLRIWY